MGMIRRSRQSWVGCHVSRLCDVIDGRWENHDLKLIALEEAHKDTLQDMLDEWGDRYFAGAWRSITACAVEMLSGGFRSI